MRDEEKVDKLLNKLKDLDIILDQLKEEAGSIDEETFWRNA